MAATPPARLHPKLDDLLELRHQVKSLGIASRHLVNSSFMGLYASVFRGTGMHFEEVRHYQPGDDVRHMEWKVTARTHRPHLKVFREERERTVILCVDKGPHMNFGTRGTFKSVQAARTAALIGWAASRQQDRVGGLVFGDPETGLLYFRPNKGRRALWRLLHALTQPPGDEAPSQDCLAGALQRAILGAGTGALVFVIADFNRDVTGLELTLASLAQRHSLVLIPVDDPADRSLPAMGRVTFSGTDGELLEVDTDHAAAAKAYHQAWEIRRNLLKALVNRMRIGLMPVQTDEDIHLTLIRSLEQHLYNPHPQPSQGH
ncbi:DUF58 domain-containing protein [Gammaproteobacteria bacterium]